MYVCIYRYTHFDIYTFIKAYVGDFVRGDQDLDSATLSPLTVLDT